MNKSTRFCIVIICCLIVFCLLSACAEGSAEAKDYAAAVRLDMNSATVKQEVSVKTFIDGDTTHFFAADGVTETGVLKARFLAVNTPESTGKIEEYGKKASDFTKEKLSQAESIIVESDDGQWNLDSTGDRHLVWVWYRTAADEEYRNLNIEILQNGLAIANSSANNRYGSVCMEAINSAKEQKLNVYSGQKDPDFYYGDAIELTLRELRMNLSEYSGKKVAFSGVITMNNDNGVYVEAYDAETDMYYGMSVYYGFGLSGAGLEILRVGNEARIVGTLQYYEAGGTWQVSGLSYRMMNPKDPNNIQKLSDGHSPAYVPTAPDTFVNGSVVEADGQSAQAWRYSELAMATSIRMEGLAVQGAFTTENKDSSSYGAITLVCEADGESIRVRTIPLKDAGGNLIEEDMFLGKTIDVNGIVDYFDGEYQIKVFKLDSIFIRP